MTKYIQAVILGVAISISLVGFSVQSLLDSKNLTDLSFDAKIEHFESAIAKNDLGKLRRLLREINMFGEEEDIGILYSGRQLVTSLSELQKKCVYSFKSQKRTLLPERVDLKMCVSLKSIFIGPFLSFHVWFLIGILLCFYIAMVHLPVFVFRTQLRNIVSTDPERLAKIKANITDSVQLKIIEQVENFYSRKMELNILKVESEHAKKLNELAIGVAHDIKSPLSLVNAVSFRLASEGSELGQMLEECTKRVNFILSDFVTQSREYASLKSKAKEVLPSGNIFSIDVESITSALVEQKKIEWAHLNKQVKFVVNCSSEVAHLRFSPYILERHLSNLINNCMKALDVQGSIQINFKCDDKQYIFQVMDSGKGIEKSVLEKIGKSFLGLSKDGMGFGLYSFKSFVKYHGGNVHIDSFLGRGTTVEFSFPRNLSL